MRGTKKDRDQFIEAYDKYALTYTDPIKVMFEIMTDEDGVDPGVRRAAASDLLAFRFPKTKAIDLQLNAENAAGFHFAMIPFGGKVQELPPGGILASEEFTAVSHAPDTRIPTLINSDDYKVHET